MHELLTNFHFIRPWCLAGLAPAILILWAMRNRRDARRPFRGVISDHLLKHLLTGESRRGNVRPWHLLTIAWCLTVVSLSGPTWRREPSPFAEDQAALFIVLKTAPSMTAGDVQPSRLERAIHKIRDLLALRGGALNGLIAYSGSAHLVMPLTKDGNIIETFAAELSPDIMPVEGDAAAAAVLLADERLEKSGLIGSVLLITDDVRPDQLKRLTDQREGKGFPVHLLAIATKTPPGNPPAPPLDENMLRKTAETLGGSLTPVTPDEADVKRIASHFERSLRTSAQVREGERWRDFGYELVPVIAILALMWFRPGWRVRYD